MQDWVVIRTKTYREKMAEEFLEKKGIRCFLPKKKDVATGTLSTSRNTKPLFPGYIFVLSAVNEMSNLNYIPGTFGMIVFNGKPAVVSSREIESIRVLATSSLAMETHHILHMGEKIRVICGPLSGIQGELVRWSNSHRLVINVPMLNQSVSVEIGKDQLVPI